MKKWLPAVLAMAILLTACAHNPGPVSPTEATTQPAAEQSAAGVAVSEKRIQQILDTGAIFFPDHGTAYIRGRSYDLTTPPFLEDGALYVPVATVAAVFGGSFVSTEDFYYLNYMGNVSIFMEEYNVLLFNTDSVIMDTTPIVKNGEMCLPLPGLCKAMSLSHDKSISQNMFVLGLQKPLKEAEFAAVRKKILGASLEEKPNEALAAMAQSHGIRLEKIEQAAKQKTLWRTDSAGQPENLWLDDTGVLRSVGYEMSRKYPENQIYISEKGQLVSLTGGARQPDTPDQRYQQELRAATGRYMELWAAKCIQDNVPKELLAGYLDAVEGDLTNSVYVADQENPFETHIYDQNSWETLLENARPGDFLVFSAGGAGPKYGFFNHSALILENSQGTLRLLHARSAELGVGADKPMDYLTVSGLTELDYYQNYDTIFLCRSGDLTDSQSQKMAWEAYDKFNNCQFGYGGRLGLEETNCAELIVDAYAAAGVEIVDDDYASRLKEVLKGNTKNLVPIPDDLLFSQNVEVIALWKR